MCSLFSDSISAIFVAMARCSMRNCWNVPMIFSLLNGSAFFPPELLLVFSAIFLLSCG